MGSIRGADVGASSIVDPAIPSRVPPLVHVGPEHRVRVDHILLAAIRHGVETSIAPSTFGGGRVEHVAQTVVQGNPVSKLLCVPGVDANAFLLSAAGQMCFPLEK